MVARKKGGATLVRLRAKVNKTQQEIAYHLGVSERQYRRWEQAECGISSRWLAPLARELGVTYAELISAIGEQQVTAETE